VNAIVWTKYGDADGLVLRQVEKPIPAAHEVCIRVYATTVTAGDVELRWLNRLNLFWLPLRLYFGVFRPRGNRILGQELSGKVESVGKDVTRFRPGESVFAATGFSLGAYAEYKCLPESGIIAEKPVNMSFEEAAAIPLEGLEALDFLRAGEVGPGQDLLINGAGGSIGTLAIQLAKHFGAEVTGVDRTEKLELMRSLGADHVEDFTFQHFTRTGRSYDIVFDVIGKSPFWRTLRALKPGGRYLLGNPGLFQRFLGRWVSRLTDKRVILGTRQRVKDLNFLKGLIESGHLKSVVDRVYPLEATPEAHRYVETGRKLGNVVISVAAD
jgi:NADPH:quinone reductase-like Zn-dependent oxidoreductase